MHDPPAELARGQHGVVAGWQLAELGFTLPMIHRRVRWKEFRPVHTGVFFVGQGPLTFRTRFMAAVLACGPEAVISHHAAAALHDLRPLPQGAIDVTAPENHRRKGIRCHVSAVPPRHRARIDAIPVTSLERTYVDYAEQSTARQLKASLEAGERRNILDLRTLQSVIDSSNGRRGITPLRAAIAELSDDPQWTQSPLEERFLELVRSTDLPRPRANVLIEGHLVDFAWPEHRLIVELDGFAFHANRGAFETDRGRDNHLQKKGWRVLRITYRRLHTDPAGVIADVRHMLNQ
jgi:very-short-patch-repair endonuclease